MLLKLAAGFRKFPGRHYFFKTAIPDL
jgi:hypothetical protein